MRLSVVNRTQCVNMKKKCKTISEKRQAKQHFIDSRRKSDKLHRKIAYVLLTEFKAYFMHCIYLKFYLQYWHVRLSK